MGVAWGLSNYVVNRWCSDVCSGANRVVMGFPAFRADRFPSLAAVLGQVATIKAQKTTRGLLQILDGVRDRSYLLTILSPMATFRTKRAKWLGENLCGSLFRFPGFSADVKGCRRWEKRLVTNRLASNFLRDERTFDLVVQMFH